MGAGVRHAAAATAAAAARRGAARGPRRQRVRRRRDRVVRRRAAAVVHLCRAGPDLVLQVGPIVHDGTNTSFFQIWAEPMHELMLVVWALHAARDQVIFDSMRRDPVVAGVVDPGIATMCHVDQQGPSDDWQQAYTSAELLSALIPSTPFPLDEQVTWHGSGPSSSTSTTAASLSSPELARYGVIQMQDAMAPVLASSMVPPTHVHEQVEAPPGSCSSNMPTDGDCTTATATPAATADAGQEPGPSRRACGQSDHAGPPVARGLQFSNF